MYKQSRDRLHAPDPDPQADGHGGPARPQDRPRLLHLRRTRLARSSWPTRTRPPPTAIRAAPRAGRTGSASSARGRWPPASSRCSPRPATTSLLRRPRRGARSPACGPRSSARWTRPSLRGKLDEEERDAALARVTGTTALDDLADRDLVVEAVVEELSVKQALFATLDEILQARRGARHDDVEPAGRRARGGHRPAGATSSGMHFFNPAQVMQLVEVVLDGEHRRATSRPRPCARVRAARQARGHLRGPGRASSSTRCCSRTSTTRSGCSRRTTPPPTTSTPR